MTAIFAEHARVHWRDAGRGISPRRSRRSTCSNGLLPLDVHSALKLEAAAFARDFEDPGRELAGTDISERAAGEEGCQAACQCGPQSAARGGDRCRHHGRRHRIYEREPRHSPVRMKDISQRQLDLGMAEASGLLQKQVSAGRIEAGASRVCPCTRSRRSWTTRA